MGAFTLDLAHLRPLIKRPSRLSLREGEIFRVQRTELHPTGPVLAHVAFFQRGVWSSPCEAREGERFNRATAKTRGVLHFLPGKSARDNAGSTDPMARSHPALPHGHFLMCPHSSDALHTVPAALDWTLHANRLSTEQMFIAKLRAASYSLFFSLHMQIGKMGRWQQCLVGNTLRCDRNF